MARTTRTGRLKAVLFDLDGVLVFTFDYWFRLFNQALIHFGRRPIGVKTFSRHWGQSTGDDVRIFLPDRTVGEVKAYFIGHVADHQRRIKVNPDAVAVLKTLKDRCLKLGCVTNSHRNIAGLELRIAGIRRFFDCLVTADDVKNPKPDPEMLMTACRRMKVRPGQTVFIGDTKTDLAAARRARCRAVGYRIKCARRVNRLERLIRLFEKNNYFG